MIYDRYHVEIVRDIKREPGVWILGENTEDMRTEREWSPLWTGCFVPIDRAMDRETSR